MIQFIALLLLAVVFGAPPLRGADLDQAKKEGEVVLYTTMIVSDFQVFQKALVKKYPFLKVNHVRLGASTLVSRAIAEFRAGKHLTDVYGVAPDSPNYMREQGILAPYASSEAKYIHKGFIDPNGFWSGITTDVLVTGVNTAQLNVKRAPHSYADYLKPEFKGKMAFHMGTNNPLIGMSEMQGEEKALAYMRSFAKQDLIQHNGYTKISQLLAAGEFPIVAFMQVTKLEKIRERNGPVDWIPLDPSFATVSSVAVSKHAPHANAARLLVDFYLSEEGQKALREIDKIPLRRGVDADSKRVAELIEQTPHVIKYEGDPGKQIKQFNEIFLGR
ncbi:MAG: extracellular solute-binding protein [Deltaproteobacteria bacterium]|nr:MAG: extracellular solute-binding protein [Deltaproteobacteria bacterium]